MWNCFIFLCIITRRIRKCAMDHFMSIHSHHFNYFVTIVKLKCPQVCSLIYTPFYYLILQRRMQIGIKVTIIYTLGTGGALIYLLLLFILLSFRNSVPTLNECCQAHLNFLIRKFQLNVKNLSNWDFWFEIMSSKKP